MKVCNKCEMDKQNDEFLADSDWPDRCKDCLTDIQINRYIQPELTKIMRGLTSKEKQKAIRWMMKKHLKELKNRDIQCSLR